MKITNNEELDIALDIFLSRIDKDPQAKAWLMLTVKGGYLSKPDFKRKTQMRDNVELGRRPSLLSRMTKDQSFKRRYFRLGHVPDKLEYFLTEECKPEEKKGEVDLTSIVEIGVSAVYQAPENSLDLVDAERHYTIAAENENQMLMWLYALKYAMAKDFTKKDKMTAMLLRGRTDEPELSLYSALLTENERKDIAAAKEQAARAQSTAGKQKAAEKGQLVCEAQTIAPDISDKSPPPNAAIGGGDDEDNEDDKLAPMALPAAALQKRSAPKAASTLESSKLPFSIPEEAMVNGVWVAEEEAIDRKEEQSILSDAGLVDTPAERARMELLKEKLRQEKEKVKQVSPAASENAAPAPQVVADVPASPLQSPRKVLAPIQAPKAIERKVVESNTRDDRTDGVPAIYNALVRFMQSRTGDSEQEVRLALQLMFYVLLMAGAYLFARTILIGLLESVKGRQSQGKEL